MRRIFLDANILLSFHFKDAEKRQQKAIDLIFLAIEKRNLEGCISILTFYQLLYFIDRKTRSPVVASARAYPYLNLLTVTPFDPLTLTDFDFTLWPDYEDGLQYICAQSGSCEGIITTNGYDYFASDLPIFDPLNFVIQMGL